MSNFVVIDLEMCRVPREKRGLYNFSNEIIEIGAVLLNKEFQIIDNFKTFVSPIYGRLTTYIENLTNIKTDDLSYAPTFENALNSFFEWLEDDATMIAWSNNDALQLKTEALCKGFVSDKLDALLENYIDCQILFAEKMCSSKVYRLSEALIIANIDYDEGAHDALVDAYNTALLFNKISTDTEFTLSPYYSANNSYAPYVHSPFADLFSELRLAI